MLLMWWVMMIAMMLPSAAPMTLTFATVNRRRRELGTPYVPTVVFVSGYLHAWGAFSLVATAAWVLVEKLLPGGGALARAAGVIAILVGAWMIV